MRTTEPPEPPDEPPDEWEESNVIDFDTHRSLFGRFAEALRGAWRSTARPEQLAPAGDWTTWVFCGGRGAGKTRSGAEWITERVQDGNARYIHLIAPTAADCRDVLLEGNR